MTRTRFIPKTNVPIWRVAFAMGLGAAIGTGLSACEPVPPPSRSAASSPVAATPTAPSPAAPADASSNSALPTSAASTAAPPSTVATAPVEAVVKPVVIEPTPKPAPIEAPLKPMVPSTTLADDPTAVRALLVPSRETTLVAQMPGVIKFMPETIGSTIAAGATAVEFDCSELQAKLAMADAEFASARETHDAKIRLQGLQSAGELEVALAAAAREKARAAITLTQVQMRSCRIEAPFGGRVVKLHAKRHQGVNAGTAVLELVATGQPRAKVNVPSKWLTWLRVGTPFNLTVDENGRAYTARVSAINARVDAVSQSIEIEGEVIGGAALLPGMSGTARFKPPG